MTTTAPQLILAQVKADVPKVGWSGRVIHQIEVCNENSLAERLANKPAAFDYVQKQVNKLPAGAEYYLDFEPGSDNPSTTSPEGWHRADVQQFWRELHAKHPKAGLFGGVSFDSYLQKQPTQAQATMAGVPWLGFPCYHGGNGASAIPLDQHLSQTRARLGRLKAAGFVTIPFVWDEYHNSAGPATAGTPVPLPDFIAGVSACREFSTAVLVWSWLADWNGLGVEEIRTAVAVGDPDPVLTGADEMYAERDGLMDDRDTALARVTVLEGRLAQIAGIAATTP